MKPTRMVAATLILSLAACATGEVASPTAGEGADFGIGPTAQCDPEVTDCGGGGGGGGGAGGGGDPAPAYGGIWLGYNTGPNRCYSATGAGIDDGDVDRFDDWCEALLANAFRPLMRFSPYDCNIGMEPRWSVKYFPVQQRARVAYLFSYYKDCGNQDGICDYSHQWSKLCFGHQGDHEFVIADLSFDATSQHWRVDKAFLSAHYGEDAVLLGALSRGDYSTFTTWTGLTYPEEQRGYFLVWVAHGKHGNYRSQSDCNSGAVFGGDDCSRHSSALVQHRTYFSANRNVGTAHHRLEDCTHSTGPEWQFRVREECYWSTERSTGWWDPMGTVSIANSSEGYVNDVLPNVIETYRLPKEPS